MLEKIKELQDTLQNKGIYADVYQYMDLPVIRVEIQWGDWKHEHLRADWIAGELGLTKIGQEITEEDGSDCYSAIHNYIYHA